MINQYFQDQQKQKYNLNVGLWDEAENKWIYLDNEHIDTFQYSNELNDLNLHGQFEYEDVNGMVDRFLERQKVRCQLMFDAVDQIQEGDVHIDKSTRKYADVVQFFIDNIQILRNEPGSVVYKFILIGTLWDKLSRSVSYSNYGDDKGIFGILKDIFSNNSINIPINTKSFDEVNSKAKIKYISSTTDNVQDCIDFLLNKLYKSNFYGGLDTALHTLMYDEVHDCVQVFDSSKINLSQGKIDIKLDLVKNTQPMKDDGITNIGYLTRKSRSQVMLDAHTTDIIRYDLSKNSFFTETIDQKMIINLQNGMNNKAQRMDGIAQPEYYKQTVPFWNNDIDYAHNIIENLLFFNSLIVNCKGYPGLLPGYLVNIIVPNEQKNWTIDDSSSNKFMTEKYKSITGPWMCSKVTHYINPKEKFFRQTMNLFKDERSQLSK